jgi:hypothetical protein
MLSCRLHLDSNTLLSGLEVRVLCQGEIASLRIMANFHDIYAG